MRLLPTQLPFRLTLSACGSIDRPGVAKNDQYFVSNDPRSRNCMRTQRVPRHGVERLESRQHVNFDASYYAGVLSSCPLIE